MLIYTNKRKFLHKNRVRFPEGCLGTPTRPPFHCFGTPIWPSWRHVNALYSWVEKLTSALKMSWLPRPSTNNWPSRHWQITTFCKALRSTLSKTDTFGIGAMCLSKADVQLIESQIMGAKQGPTLDVCFTEVSSLRESPLYSESNSLSNK